MDVETTKMLCLGGVILVLLLIRTIASMGTRPTAEQKHDRSREFWRIYRGGDRQ